MFFVDIFRNFKAELETSHEEADTKITFHAMHLGKADNASVILFDFSPSGDTDIIVSL